MANDERMRCSLCGKLSMALMGVFSYAHSLELRVCEACARSTLEGVELAKQANNLASPPPSLDFNRETAHSVLVKACSTLANAANIECEQFIGDVIWGGGSFAQDRLATRLATIQLHWSKRIELARIAREAEASKFDAMPELVEKANKISNAQTLEELRRVVPDFDERKIVERVREEIQVLREWQARKRQAYSPHFSLPASVAELSQGHWSDRSGVSSLEELTPKQKFQQGDAGACKHGRIVTKMVLPFLEENMKPLDLLTLSFRKGLMPGEGLLEQLYVPVHVAPSEMATYLARVVRSRADLISEQDHLVFFVELKRGGAVEPKRNLLTWNHSLMMKNEDQ